MPRIMTGVARRSSRRLLQAALLTMALAGAEQAHAQMGIKGKVRDLASQAPIGRVTVNLLNVKDSILQSILTSDSGTFFVRLTTPGTYSVQMRRVGWTPILTERFDMAAGDTMAFDVEMGRPAVTLDTVVILDTPAGIWQVTPGKEFARKHFADGVGLILNGWEIEKSGLTLTGYLGKQAGISVTKAGATIVPGIPGIEKQMIYSTVGDGCLYARVDRGSVLFKLAFEVAGWIDDALKLKNVMAVEVYLSKEEVPKEWQRDAQGEAIYGRNFQGGQTPSDYRVGHTGLMNISSEVLEEDSLRFGTTRVADPAGQCGFVQIWTSTAW
jgi:hypothetical protein